MNAYYIFIHYHIMVLVRFSVRILRERKHSHH